MKLGLSIGYSGAELKLPVEKVLLAERLGFDSVWTAEAYGSDAITPLAYLAALTKRIRLGTGIMQLAARPPASAAMAAGTRRRARRRRPRHRRARRLRPADRRGLVRAAVGQAVLAHPRLRRDHAQGLRAQGPGGARGARDLAALHRPRRARRRQAAHVDPAHEPAAADLARHRHRGEREAHRGDRRRLAAARLRAAAHADAAARGSRRASAAPAAARASPTSRSRRAPRSSSPTTCAARSRA